MKRPVKGKGKEHSEDNRRTNKKKEKWNFAEEKEFVL